MTKRIIHRDWNEEERKRHGQQVSERFAREREENIQKLKELIEEMLSNGVKISQNEVARRSDVSVGFINSHLGEWIELVKKRQRDSAKKSRSIRQIASEAKEIEDLKVQVDKLKQKLKEQQKLNEALLAQVAQVVDLERDIKILRQQNRDLINAQKAVNEKVINLPRNPQSLPVLTYSNQSHPDSKHSDDNLIQTLTFKDIEAALSQLNITLNSGLRQEIKKHEILSVLKAIEAFEQYRREHIINQPIACLRQAIREEWQPNVLVENTVTLETSEFDKWYAEAILKSFCLDIPKNHLSEINGEFMVKVIDHQQVNGYVPMPWREAKAHMEETESITGIT